MNGGGPPHDWHPPPRPPRRRILRLVAVIVALATDLVFAAIGVRLLIAGAEGTQFFAYTIIPSGVWTIIGGLIVISATLGGVVAAAILGRG